MAIKVERFDDFFPRPTRILINFRDPDATADYYVFLAISCLRLILHRSRRELFGDKCNSTSITMVFLLSFITFTGCNEGENDGKNEDFVNSKEKMFTKFRQSDGYQYKEDSLFNIL